MTRTEDIIAYQSRWEAVEAVVIQERRSASFELRWRQLNAAYGMAKGLGLLQSDQSEVEIFERWAKLKEKSSARPRKYNPPLSPAPGLAKPAGSVRRSMIIMRLAEGSG